MRFQPTHARSLRFTACVAACLSLAACGDTSVVPEPNVTIGGTISGLTGGTVVLENNGGDPLSAAENGPFTFASAIANGATYSVTVAMEPNGQTCVVSNGSGTATADVTDVTVECAAFELRPLPEIYATGTAINYSAYRAAGPAEGEVPSDADILEDLGLLQTAGFNLLRLFGADPVSEKILQLAAANFPEMRFQQGIFLEGLAGAAAEACDSQLNEDQVETAIRLADTYSNVVTVSVGNETSFYSAFMPLNCLEGYITETRKNVTQPVTADDDYTFYAGLNAVGGERVGSKPDTVLPLLDFVSIHIYPIIYYREWDWQQTAVPPGPDRAAAMMNASLARAQANYQSVYDYEYRNASGETVTVGASLPIVVGETGWKWRQTAPAQQIEAYAALQVNAKWYYDLLQTWEGSPGLPPTIFYFEAFDEAWKGTDDGWGIWDEFRMPLYALCGTPAGSPCNDDVYEGAGYYLP